MTQIYSDPKRESEPGALPDVEVWCAPIKLVGCGRCGGESEMPVSADTVCHSCGDSERVNRIEGTARIGWWWQACFPGCLPDGDPSGPFDTEAEAIADAREGVEDGDLDAGEDEPGEEDYYLSDDARSIYYCGKVIVGPVPADAEPCPQDAVMELLAEYIDEDGYAPDVWKISDHGNPILISVQECGCYFTEHRGQACDRTTEARAGEVQS